uniref:Uncharacterized protein n=1 Tax=Siphoviridae sp. ctES717 TaxID=2827564 RepID=A0A8S5RSK5_9CAUD|nr:MAG TPA: Protein of unknown function (DUF3963) [Siphoviridae sp. ctES717]
MQSQFFYIEKYYKNITEILRLHYERIMCCF